jgi:uncharacterized protein YndB with AHSA1/START domain
MAVQTYSIVAKTTPEKAYAYIADLTKHPEWSPDDMKMSPDSPGEVRVGSTYHAEGNLVGRRNPSTVEITALEPGRLVAFTSTDGNSKWQHEFRFVSENGGTRIDRTVTPLKTPPGFGVLFFLLHPFVIGPGNMKTLGMLRDRLEA